MSLLDRIREARFNAGLAKRDPSPEDVQRDRDNLEQAKAMLGSFGPRPGFFTGKHRPRLAIRSANDDEKRRAMRRAFKGIRPLRSSLRPVERDWRARSEA